MRDGQGETPKTSGHFARRFSLAVDRGGIYKSINCLMLAQKTGAQDPQDSLAVCMRRTTGKAVENEMGL
jgi:hypothetical protein